MSEAERVFTMKHWWRPCLLSAHTGGFYTSHTGVAITTQTAIKLKALLHFFLVYTVHLWALILRIHILFFSIYTQLKSFFFVVSFKGESTFCFTRWQTCGSEFAIECCTTVSTNQVIWLDMRQSVSADIDYNSTGTFNFIYSQRYSLYNKAPLCAASMVWNGINASCPLSGQSHVSNGDS